MNRHFPTVIALIMLVGMLGLMSNCQVKTDVPLEYNAPTDISEHLDENGEPMKKRIVSYESVSYTHLTLPTKRIV